MKMRFKRYLAVQNPRDIAFFITIGYANGKMLGMAELIRSDIASMYGFEWQGGSTVGLPKIFSGKSVNPPVELWVKP